jgi:hypothetical protein
MAAYVVTTAGNTEYLEHLLKIISG